MDRHFPPPPGQLWLLSEVDVPGTIAMMAVLAVICIGAIAVWRWRVRAAAICSGCGSGNDDGHFLVMQKDGGFICNLCAMKDD